MTALSMDQETLEGHLRRATRNFTAPLAEEAVLSLGRDLARELARAHAESPARHPDLDPATVPMTAGHPRIEGGATAGDAGEALFRLGALLNSLAIGAPAEVSWRLDGPPPAPMSTVVRRAVLATLGSPRREQRYPSATAAMEALEAALAPAETGPASWPLFRSDPSRTGSRSAAAPPATLAPAWEAPLGPVVSSPTLTRQLAFAAPGDGRIVFLDRRDGRRLHEMRVASAVESSPALASGTLYLGTDDGDVIAIDVLTGAERYRARIGQMVRSSPLPAGDLLLVGVVEAKNAGGLVALDPKGKTVWKRPLGPVFSSPAQAGEFVVVGSDDGSLHAVEPGKGKLVWSHALGAKVRATPAVAGGLAIVGDFAGRIAAVRVADGSRAWLFETGHPIYSSACVSSGLAVFGCNEGHVHGVDVATGASRFEVKTGGPVVASAVALGDRFLIGSTDGSLYLLDAAGQVVHRIALGAGGLQSSPAADTDGLIVGSGGGLHAFRFGA